MPPLRLVERARNFGKVRKRKKRRPIGDTILGTQLLLTTLRDSSDVCPPLKSIVGGLCKILETIEGEIDNRKSAKDLAQRAYTVLFSLAHSVPTTPSVPQGLSDALGQLEKTVSEIVTQLERLRDRPHWGRVVLQVRDRGVLGDLTIKLDDAWRLFDSTSSIRIGITQQEILLGQQQQRLDMGTMPGTNEPSTGRVPHSGNTDPPVVVSNTVTVGPVSVCNQVGTTRSPRSEESSFDRISSVSIATLQSLWYPGYLCDQMVIDTLRANTGLVRQFACVSGRIRFDRLHRYIKENRQRLGCRDLYSRGLKWIEKHLFSLKCEESNSLVISQRTSPA